VTQTPSVLAAYDALLVRVFRYLPRLSGACAIVAGALGLTGWWLEIPALFQFGHDSASMKPNTALCLVLLGTAMLWQEKARASAALVAAIGAFTLFEYGALSGASAFDQLLAHADAQVGILRPGRMSLMAATSFFVLGGAVLIMRKRASVAQGLAFFAAVFSLVPLLGYLFGVAPLLEFASFDYIAPQTTVALLLLCGGVVAQTRECGIGALFVDETAGGALARRLFPAALAVPIVIGWIRLQGQRAGYYGTEMGLALFVSANVMTFFALSWRSARHLAIEEIERTRFAAELANLNATLEARVLERTQALRSSEQLYRTLVNNLPQALVVLFDLQLRCVLVDGGSLLGLLGLVKTDLEGRPLLETALEENRASLGKAYAAALMGVTSQIEAPRNGRMLSVHVVPVLDDEGRVIAGMSVSYDVTHLKAAEAARLQSEAHFRNLIEAMPLAVLAHRDGQIVYANPSTAASLGYASAEVLVGKHLLSVIHPDDHAQARARMRGLAAEGDKRGPTLVRVLRADGAELITEVMDLKLAFEGKPAVFSVAQDITRRIQAERELNEATALWRAILDGADYAIIATTPDGIIREFNNAAQRMLGYERSDVIDKLTPAIIHDESEVAARASAMSRELGETIAPGLEVFLHKPRIGLPEENEWTYLRKDGSRFPVRLSITALHDASGEITGFMGIANDISEHKKAQKDLLTAKEAAESAMRARTAFLARMSHELRTPINGALGMLELALQTELTAQQHDYLDTAKASAASLLAIINDVLDFSKIDAGMLKIEVAPFALREGLSAALRGFMAAAKVKGVAILSQVASDVPERVTGDSLRLQQIIVNLVSNALKFTEHGTITVSVERRAATAASVTLAFAVTDTGIGIPKDKQALIFEAFRQADENTTRLFGGTGLGLAICVELAELLGGTLRVESEVGRGTRFELVLPFAPADNAPAPRPLQAPPPRVVRALKILVADDNLTNRRVAAGLLSKVGHVIVTVEDGRQALTAIAKEKFDLVLMDVQMPEMDGLEATRRLRAAETAMGGHLPVIALTAQAMQGDREKCLEAGADGYAAKPINMNELLATIEGLMGGSAEQAPPSEARPAVAPAPYDHSDSLRRMAGDEALLGEVIALLLQDFPERLSALQLAVTNQDMKRVRETAHVLSGMLANIAAEPARGLAKRIEEGARSGSLNESREVLDVLITEWERLKLALVRGVDA
jgi:PAS domain S-box-containing protein